MSPPGGRRCPPALLALLLGLAGSRGSPECQNLAVAAGGSLCLVPDKTLRNWIIIQWKMEITPTSLQQILTASRDGAVSSPRGPFHGRAKFQPGNFSLCISPVHRADNGVYRVEFQSSSRISSRCFRVSVWEIPDNFGHWTLLAVALAVAVGLALLLVGGCCWWRERRKNSREETPVAPPGPPVQELTVYAEVGEKKPRQDPAGTGEATQEGATVYAVVSPRTLEHPRHREEPGNFTVYSTVQFSRTPSSIKRKRLDPALVSTAYLEDNGGYRRLGFPNPAGHQRP